MRALQYYCAAGAMLFLLSENYYCVSAGLSRCRSTCRNTLPQCYNLLIMNAPKGYSYSVYNKGHSMSTLAFEKDTEFAMFKSLVPFDRIKIKAHNSMNKSHVAAAAALVNWRKTQYNVFNRICGTTPSECETVVLRHTDVRYGDDIALVALSTSSVVSLRTGTCSNTRGNCMKRKSKWNTTDKAFVTTDCENTENYTTMTYSEEMPPSFDCLMYTNRTNTVLIGVVNKTTHVMSMMPTFPAQRLSMADNGTVLGCVVFAPASDGGGAAAAAARYERTIHNTTILVYRPKHNTGKIFKSVHIVSPKLRENNLTSWPLEELRSHKQKDEGSSAGSADSAGSLRLALYAAIPAVLLAPSLAAIVYVCIKKSSQQKLRLNTLVRMRMPSPFYLNQLFQRENEEEIYYLEQENQYEVIL